MSISVPPEHRRFTFFQALPARLGGESMSFLTLPARCWAKHQGGDAAKRVPMVHGVLH